MARFSSPTSLLSAVLPHGRELGIQAFESERGAPLPRPIDASQIEEGMPVARYHPFSESPDKRLSSGLWECSAGKFKVTFWLDEIVHILDGEVTVRQTNDGVTYTLREGDTAYFPLGLVTSWHVPRFVRKFYVVRAPGGSPLVARVRQRLAI
jgi:uncharacterized cupin superfamily protein